MRAPPAKIACNRRVIMEAKPLRDTVPPAMALPLDSAHALALAMAQAGCLRPSIVHVLVTFGGLPFATAAHIVRTLGP